MPRALRSTRMPLDLVEFPVTTVRIGWTAICRAVAVAGSVLFRIRLTADGDATGESSVDRGIGDLLLPSVGNRSRSAKTAAGLGRENPVSDIT